MSNMRPEDEVIAIVCSDIHLSHKPPLARSGEPDWYAAMARPLSELRGLHSDYGVPVVIAGDIFDRWNSPPELIRFALDNLPKGAWVIPGQHDLPYHDYGSLNRSALGVLIKAGWVNLLPPDGQVPFKVTNGQAQFRVTGFAWGMPIQPSISKIGLQVAVIHAYCWKQGNSYYDAGEESNVKSFFSQLKGYDVAIFGDNHTPFEAKSGSLRIFNCGGFMRRKSDEANLRPSCGLLHADGRITRHYFDISQDVLERTTDDSPNPMDSSEIEAFVKSLTKLDCDPLDFAAQLRIVTEKESRSHVQQILRELADAYQ